jgi:hypothetical protein
VNHFKKSYLVPLFCAYDIAYEKTPWSATSASGKLLPRYPRSQVNCCFY